MEECKIKITTLDCRAADLGLLRDPLGGILQEIDLERIGSGRVH